MNEQTSPIEEAQAQLEELKTRCRKGPVHMNISMTQFVLGSRKFDFPKNFNSSLKELHLAQRSAVSWVNDADTMNTYVHIFLHPEAYEEDGLGNMKSRVLGKYVNRSQITFGFTRYASKDTNSLFSPRSKINAHLRFARAETNQFYLSDAGATGQQYLVYLEYLQEVETQEIKLSSEESKTKMTIDGNVVKLIYAMHKQALEFGADSTFATEMVEKCFQDYKSKYTRTLNVHLFSSWVDYYDQLSVQGKELFCCQVSLFILKHKL